MASSGGGSGTPISPGPAGPFVFAIAEPLPYTLLSLPKYAQLTGINPVHFQGASGTEVFPFLQNSCNDLIPQTSWQATGRVSREDIAHAILEAESEIAQVLGYWPAPYWIAQEPHPYPQHYRSDVWAIGGLDVRLQRSGIQTNFGKVIAPGQRAVSTLIGTAVTTDGSLVYSDADGDGFVETATVTLPTTLTDVCELKVYFAGTGGQQEWEIRGERSKSATGVAVTFNFPAWLFVDRDIQSAYPTTDGFQGINLDTTANYVTSVELYREYNDTTAIHAEFFWQPSPQLLNGFCSSCGGTGCVSCQLTTQTGCFTIRDAETGIVSPSPASYDAGWSGECFTVCRNPDEVTLYYKSGKLPNINLRGVSCQELDNRMARAIMQYATTKLVRPVCSCQAVTARYRWLREELALAGETSFQITPDDLDSPFGTMRGALLCWRYISNVAEHVLRGTVV